MGWKGKLQKYRTPPAKAGRRRRTKDPTVLALEGRRIVICDYNALLLSVTGLLRMSGYCVFQAYNADAARELCLTLPRISLLILNTTGTGTDTPTLVRTIREDHPKLHVLHIGRAALLGMPTDVPTLAESFSPGELLTAVEALMSPPDKASTEAQ
jgi:DNA-binding response OmpR family regulator